MATIDSKTECGLIDDESEPKAKPHQPSGHIKLGKKGRPPLVFEFGGLTLTLEQWAERLSLTVKALRYRISVGMPAEVIFSSGNLERDYRSNTRPPKLYTHDGLSLSLRDWEARLGVRAATLYQRISYGLPPEKVFTAEALKKGVKEGHHFNNRAPRKPRVCNARKIEYQGQTMTIKEWAEKLGLNENTLRFRLNDGQPLDIAFDATRNRPKAIARKETTPIRCFVCNTLISHRLADKGQFIQHTRFKKAHIRCHKDWLKVQHELTGGRKKLKDLG